MGCSALGFFVYETVKIIKKRVERVTMRMMISVITMVAWIIRSCMRKRLNAKRLTIVPEMIIVHLMIKLLRARCVLTLAMNGQPII